MFKGKMNSDLSIKIKNENLLLLLHKIDFLTFLNFSSLNPRGDGQTNLALGVCSSSFYSVESLCDYLF